MTAVEDGHVEPLKKYLNEVGGKVGNTPEIHFRDYVTLHYCSLQVIEDPFGADRPLLVFEGNIDGPVRPFLEALAADPAPFLRTAYAGCVGFPTGGSPVAVADYLVAHDMGANAFYVGQPGMTRQQIVCDQALRDRLEEELDRRAAEFAGLTPDECRRRLAEYVAGLPDMDWVRRPVRPPFRVRYGRSILAGLVVAGLAPLTLLLLFALWPTTASGVRAAAATALVAAAAAAVGYVVWLRRRESRDHQDDTLPPADFVARLQQREDLQLQNHLVSVTEVKPGRLRLLTLRLVLCAIRLLARYVATRGDLAGIVTIHFARWVILNPPGASRPRLLFLSNYDGTWENYLGEFIDRASAGLTAVWSNTQLGPDRGFPDTRWLFRAGGSRDEPRFKNYARQSQQTGGVWYSAYPRLSMKHIANNREVRVGLFATGGDAAAWLRRL